MTDAELLQEYVEGKTESALQALVERHLPLVYSSAFRQVRHAVLSENVAHVTFLLLVREAERLSDATVLPNWLFHTVRRAVSKVVRVQARPGEREQEALRLQDAQGDIWDQVSLFIDDALNQLGDVERAAVLLRHFQNRRAHATAATLRMAEEDSERCVNLAVQMMQKFLAKRGVQIPLAAVPGLLMTHGALAAPSYLAADIIGTAVNTKVISTAVYALLKDSMTESLWRTNKRAMTAAAVAAVLVMAIPRFWPKQAPAAFAARPAVSSSLPPSPSVAVAPATPPARPPEAPFLSPATAPVTPVPETLPPRPPRDAAVIQPVRPVVATSPVMVATNPVAAAIAPPIARINTPGTINDQNRVLGLSLNVRSSPNQAFGPQQSVNTSSAVVINVPAAQSKFISNNYSARWSQPKQSPKPSQKRSTTRK
jgi:DNA-directed RNA polymerase specialized sigma24 family protein